MAIGPSGAGKSSLCLQLMGMGAVLVADDRTRVRRRDGQLWASAPDSLKGRIEARGIGILAAESCATVALALVVDMGRAEDTRLPPERTHEILGLALPCLHKSDSPHFAAAIALYLRGGRLA